MLTDSAEPRPELTINNFSFEALQDASWADLERFTIEVLSRYYEPFGLSIRRTEKRFTGDIGGDGSRDGEATILLGGGPLPVGTPSSALPVLHPELGVLVTVWVEVKKRSRENVDHHDLGGTIFRSSIENVTKLVFVCNRDFTQRFRDDLARYASRNGVQYALIDGKALIQLAEEVLRPLGTSLSPGFSHEVKPDVRVHLRFSPDHLFRHAEAACAMIERTVGEVFFVEAACSVVGVASLRTAIHIDLQYTGDELVHIDPRFGTNQQAVGTGDHFRTVFGVMASRTCSLSLEHFSVRIFDDNGAAIRCSISRSSGSCQMRGTILPDWVPPSKMLIHDEFRRLVEDWMHSGGPRAADVVSIAGAGKTHLVRSLRRLWLCGGAHEVYLDGSVEQATNVAALAILGQLFPVPMDEVTSDLSRTIAEWLTRSGLAEKEAGSLARYLTSGIEAGELPFTYSQLGQFLAQILSKRSEQRPIVLVFEDLHKCLPTLVSMLQSVRQALERSRAGTVLTLYTSREDSVWDDEAVRAGWRQSFDQMRTAGGAKQFQLSGLRREEAVALLREAIPAIEDYHAEGIVDQIGTTPFGLRESLGLLCELRALEPSDKNGAWHLTRPERMIRALDSREIRRPTHYRLKGLQERYPPWLSDFLGSAACIGTSFDPTICATNAGIPDVQSLEQSLAECKRLEILRFSGASPTDLQFDHDLIRLILLEDMGHFQQRRLAKGLFAILANQAHPSRLSSLAYQAGMANACWSNVMKQVEIACAAHRHLEAVHALGLALAVTDSNVASNVFAVRTGRYRPSFDDAIAVAEPCVRSDLDRPTVEHQVAELLLKYIEHLVAVGSGASPSIDKALTEAGMLAERFHDNLLRATVKMYHGRQEFNRGNSSESVRIHEMAEGIFATLPQTNQSRQRRAQNLIRMAIALRQTGELKASQEILLRAAKLARHESWALLTNIRANLGATFFYTDWAETRRHWERALRLAVKGGFIDREVHALVDLGHLDVLEGNSEAANESLEKALLLSRSHGLENSELRCLLNLGCLALMRNEPKAAIQLFREADRLGFRHEIGRRLWRVRANMATAYFLLGDMERSAATDRMTVDSMSPIEQQTASLDSSRPWIGTRLVLALANIALRARRSPVHEELLNALPQAAKRSAGEIAAAVFEGRLGSLPGLRGRHCKALGSHLFFIITE